MLATAIPHAPPSSLLPYFGPGRAGQIVPRLDLRYLQSEAPATGISDPFGDAGDGGGPIWVPALVVVAGLGALAAVAYLNNRPRRRRR